MTMKKICLLFFFVHQIAASCRETFVDNDDYNEYLLDYYDDSRSREPTRESATMTCVNLTSFKNLPLPEMYEHVPQEYEQFLNISNSRFISIPPEAFAKFYSISKLYLSGNRILFIQDKAFGNLTNLKELYLDDNNLREILTGMLDPLSSLEILDVSDNQIIMLGPKVFKELKKLRILNLKNNFFLLLPGHVFADLISLETLDLSKNQFSKFPDHTFVNGDDWVLDKLANVDFSENQINLFEYDLSNTSIATLNFSGNVLESFDFFLLPSEILKVDLSNNQIVKVINTDFLQNAQIDLSHNKIQVLKNGFSGCRAINISYNQIEKLEDNLFNKSKILISADFSHNNISEIGQNVFSDLSYLEKLYLDHNQISDLAPGTFNNLGRLQTLDLSYNQLTNFKFGIFQTLTELRILKLSGNQFSSLDQHAIYPLSKLKDLYLDRNRISSIDVEALVVHCTDLKTISLNHNNWTCKNLADMHHTFRIHNVEIALGKSFDVENFLGIECQNPKEVDTPSTINSSVLTENLLREFKKAVNRGVHNSKIHSFFNEDFKNSRFYQYFNKSGKFNNSKIVDRKSASSHGNILIATNCIQIILSVILLCLISLSFFKLRNSRFSLSQFTSQTQLYYKP